MTAPHAGGRGCPRAVPFVGLEESLGPRSQTLSLLHRQPMKPLKATATTSQPVLTLQQIETIFYKIQDIYEIHKEFYDNLCPKVQQWDSNITMGHLFQKLVCTLLGWVIHIPCLRDRLRWFMALSGLWGCRGHSRHLADPTPPPAHRPASLGCTRPLWITTKLLWKQLRSAARATISSRRSPR